MTPTHPPSELAALLELSERATPGEWRWSENGNIVTDTPDTGCDPEIAAVYSEHMDVDAADTSEPANSAFICALVNWFRSTRAAALPQGESVEDVTDARRFRDLVGWYDGLKMSHAETVCALLGLPEADPIHAGFDDLVDAYAANRDATVTPPAELGKGDEL